MFVVVFVVLGYVGKFEVCDGDVLGGEQFGDVFYEWVVYWCFGVMGENQGG